jgi:hypothetical protein
MVSGKYEHGNQSFGNGDIDWVNDPIYAALVDTDQYSVDLAADAYYADLPSGAIINSILLTGKSNVRGVLGADPTVFPNVAVGINIGAIILWKDTGIASSSQLIAYIDNAPELPATGDGDDVTISWDTGLNKILHL